MKILAVERLRGVAILIVYLIHVSLYGDAFGVFRPLARLGTWAGVDLFFVISGFVVTLSLERLVPDASLSAPTGKWGLAERNAMRSFYIRRFFRLAPIAATAVLLHFIGAAIGPRIYPQTLFLTPSEWFREACAVASGIYNFVAPHLGEHPAMVFFWSLSVEEQFYLLLPAMFLLVRSRTGRTIGALGVLVLVAGVIRPLFSPNVFVLAHFSSQYRFDSLAAGVLLALQRDRVTSFLVGLPGALKKTLVFVAFGVLLYVSRHTDIWFAVHNGLVLIWAASAFLIACAAADGKDVLDVPVVNHALEYVGSRSYAIYVLHTGFLMWDDTLFHGAGPNAAAFLASRAGQSLRFLFVGSVVLLAAEAAHRFIELPCIRIGKRVVATRALRAAAEAAV